ncbi:MAG: hypothetical protein DRJ15_17575 [Bacteroidetes bacterium]|nr:MAG: hypothetical protein DRJ15_17575 [Bacteroidota bacterium]
MGITNSNVSYSGLVEKYIGTAYDTVKIVADNIEEVIKVGQIDGIEDITDDIEEAVIIVKEYTERAELAADSAEADAIKTAADVISTTENAANAQASEDQTALDVVTTNNNVIQTNNDAISTGQDAAQTAIDRISCSDSEQQTGADVIQTNAAVVASAQNASDADIAANEAEAALFTFQGQYLGASAIPPLVDGNGNPLTSGDLYQDTSVTPNLMMFWNGAAWLQAFAVADEGNHAALSGLANVADHPGYSTLDGNRPFTGAIEIPVGLVNDPAVQFTGDINTGIYSAQIGEISFAITSSKVLAILNTGLDITGNITLTGTVDGVDISDLNTTVVNKEDGLGNPVTDDFALISLADGTRKWEQRVTPTELINGLAFKEDSLGNPPDDNNRTLTSLSDGTREWKTQPTSFNTLDDVAPYDAHANKHLIVNATGDGITYIQPDAVTLIISTTEPDSPSHGLVWLDSVVGLIYTFYISPSTASEAWIRAGYASDITYNPVGELNFPLNPIKGQTIDDSNGETWICEDNGPVKWVRKGETVALADGSVPFTGQINIQPLTPTEDFHSTRKDYVDSQTSDVWDINKVYSIGDMSTLSDKAYISLTDNNQNNSPEISPIDWASVSGGAIWRADTSPIDKVKYPQWFNTATGKTWTWYDDGDTTQWVQDVAQSEGNLVAVGSIGMPQLNNNITNPDMSGAGYVVESGSNANGSWVKFADGTMICSHTGSLLTTDSTGTVWLYASEVFVFPVSFVDIPVVSGGSNIVSQFTQYSGAQTISETNFTAYLLGESLTSQGRVSYHAIGRWK